MAHGSRRVVLIVQLHAQRPGLREAYLDGPRAADLQRHHVLQGPVELREHGRGALGVIKGFDHVTKVERLKVNGRTRTRG